MKEKMTIIFFSGTMDKAIAMLILATTAASMGMEVHLFFTFWGLSLIKKNKKYQGKNLLQRMMEFMLPGNQKKLPITNFNLLGLGPAMMGKLMEKAKMPTIAELLTLSKTLKVKIYACSTSLGVMGVEQGNLIEEVDDVVGAAAFLKEAKEAKINLFI